MSAGIGLGLLGASGHASAEPAGAPPLVAPTPPVAAATSREVESAARTIEARRLYQEGNAAAAAHQWQKAHDAYLAAFRQRQHWQVAGSLGQMELKLDRPRDAALHLTLFLREAKDVAPEELAHVREWLAQARARVGVMTIAAAPAGAEILVDGVPVGSAPLGEEMFVAPGKHRVESRLGACVSGAEVELLPGRAREIALRCESAPPAAASTVSPAAPAPLAAPSAGSPAWPHRSAVLITGGGLTMASLALGFTSMAVFSAAGSRARERREPASGPAATEEARFKSVAVWSFVAAGLAGAGTIVYEKMTERPRDPPLRGGLFVGPTGAAAVLQGQF